MNNVYPKHTSLLNVIESLPGISNISSNSKMNYDGTLMIFFYVSGTDKGLFLLTRCCDRRYWKYGNFWKIEVVVGDMFENNILPITYILSSGDIKGDEAINQSNDLIDNINLHLNHDSFLTGYNLDRNMFLRKYTSFRRKLKLKALERYK